MKYSKEIFYQEFIRREDSTNRAPYNPELEFYSIIQNGDIEQVKELCKASPLKDKKGLGLLSEKPVNNIRYHFVITTALVARYCIEGGLDVATAYNLSDFYIKKSDTMKSVEDISELHAFMCIDYGTNTQTGAIGMAQANDSVSKNIQNQIANALERVSCDQTPLLSGSALETAFHLCRMHLLRCGSKTDISHLDTFVFFLQALQH